MSQSEIVVEGRNLTIGYQVGKKRTEVHSRLNFQLFRGELTCLLGANGAGKSTLLRTLAAAQPSLSGDLKLLGRADITSWWSPKIHSAWLAKVRADTWNTQGRNSPAILYMFGIISNRPCEAVYVVVSAPACKEP